MNDKIDVLAVLELAIKRTSPTTNFKDRANLWAAHGVIADLIDAARSAQHLLDSEGLVLPSLDNVISRIKGA